MLRWLDAQQKEWESSYVGHWVGVDDSKDKRAKARERRLAAKNNS